MPNQRTFDQVIERANGSGIKTGSIDAILRGAEPVRCGVAVDIRTPTEGERAPNGKDYHVKMRASTAKVARDGGIIPMKAWGGGGLERFMENPVILAYHDYKNPIGISVHTEINKKEQSLIEYWQFHEESETSRMMKKLYEKGFMRAASVGFNVKDFEFVDLEKEKQLQKEYGTDEPIYWIAIRAELLETSAVPVPADPYALAIEHAIDNGRAFGIDVSSFTKRNTPKEIPVAEPVKKEVISGTPAAADTVTTVSVETLTADVVKLTAENTAFRGQVAAFEVRLSAVEKLGAERAPKVEDTTEGVATRADAEDETDFVEIELREGETEEQGLARFVSEAVALQTGAPVAK